MLGVIGTLAIQPDQERLPGQLHRSHPDPQSAVGFGQRGRTGQIGQQAGAARDARKPRPGETEGTVGPVATWRVTQVLGGHRCVVQFHFSVAPGT